jgi:hypothetical protein
MAKEIKVNWAGVFEIMRGEGVTSQVSSIAQRVASGSSQSVEVIWDIPMEVRVLGPEIAGRRFGGRPRAAVIVTHPSPEGQELGIRALISSL